MADADTHRATHASRPSALDLTPEVVTALQAARGRPCVSVLMSTERAPRMTSADADRLRHLALQAEERVPLETSPQDAREVLGRLEDLLIEAQEGPTSAALALYTSSTRSHRVLLPLEVLDRVVVDPTFAPRDLVRALHRAPRHVLLVLTTGEARLFEETGGALAPVPASGFPRRAERGWGAPREHPATRTEEEEWANRSFLRGVDKALGKHLALHPAPLVLAGPEEVVTSFVRRSHNLARLAGTLTGDDARAPLLQLRERVRPVLDAYLHSRQQEALGLLEQRVAAGRVVSGVPACWLAARYEVPELLAVEDDLYYPARVGDYGDRLTPTADVEDPEVVDDAVDELIELVLRRGGWVALVDPGALAAHEGVALALRSRW